MSNGVVVGPAYGTTHLHSHVGRREREVLDGDIGDRAAGSAPTGWRLDDWSRRIVAAARGQKTEQQNVSEYAESSHPYPPLVAGEVGNTQHAVMRMAMGPIPL